MNDSELIFEAYMKSKDAIPGGKGDDKSCQDIATHHGVPLEHIKKQMDIGTKIEMEHTDSKEKAREIAHDHLWESPDYYTALRGMEKKLKID